MTKGIDVSLEGFGKLFGLAQTTVDEWIEEGMPCTRTGGDGDDEAPELDFDPSNCSKRNVARAFATTPANVDTWVRQGCPCTPSGQGRSPLIFDLPKVFRWHHVYKSSNRAAAERDVKIWDLQLSIERLVLSLVEKGLLIDD